MITLMLCIRATRPPSIPSMRERCSRCEEYVWLSLGGSAARDRLGLELICVECAAPDVDGDTEIALTREVADEVRDWRASRN